MFSALAKLLAAFPAVVLGLGLAVLGGCQASRTDGLDPTADIREVPVMIVTTGGIPVYYPPPEDVQGLVNRSQAIVIGAISGVYASVYHIDVEEVLLDDEYIQAHPYLLLGNDDDAMYPQVGERFLLALVRNPVYVGPYYEGMYGTITYDASSDWMMIALQSGGIRNYDGSLVGYAGVSDEASLVRAIREAVANYNHLPRREWPKFLGSGDGNIPGRTVEYIGPGDGDAGPVGDVNN